MVGISGFDDVTLVYESRRSNVARALRCQDGRQVMLKWPAVPNPSAVDRSVYGHALANGRLLSGPHVCETLELRTYGTRPLLVFADAGFAPLADTVRRQPLGVDAALRYALSLARALEAIHSTGRIHRDLSIDNIVVGAEPGALEVVDLECAVRTDGADEAEASLSDAVLSPEHTGRTGLAVSARSDLYACGLAMFFLFAGRPAFLEHGPLELNHAHLAVLPPDLHRLDERIPPTIARIVGRLLRKDPAERYQTAAGLAVDLERCLVSKVASGAVLNLDLSGWRVPGELRFPHRRYGSGADVAAIRSVLDRASEGAGAQLVRVIGPSGSGKTTLAERSCTEARRLGGYVMAGKCEPDDRRPWGPIAAAVQQAVVDIRVSPDSQRLVEDLRTRAGGSLAALVRLAPTFEAFLGPREGGGPDARRELHRAFIAAVSVGAARRVPFVVFLDDVQWAQPEIIDLVEHLLESAVTGVVVLVSSRDELTLSDHDDAVLVRPEPLGPAVLSDYLSDVLGSTRGVEHLASVIVRQTQGNPMAVHEYLERARRTGVLRYDVGDMAWTWSRDGIASLELDERQASSLLDDVVAELAPHTVRALSAAATIGAVFSVEEIAAGLAVPAADADDRLYPAIDAMLVRPAPDVERPAITYRFVHDRVREQFQGLLDPDECRLVRLRVGRMQRDRYADSRRFDAVAHLNAAIELIDTDECRRLSVDGAGAGEEASAGAAYSASVDLFAGAASAATRVGDIAASMQHRLRAAEEAFRLGDVQRGERLLVEVEGRLDDTIARARASFLRLRLAMSRQEQDRALEAGLSALAELGVHLPGKATRVRALQAVLRCRRRVRRVDERIVDADECTDVDAVLAQRILTELFGFAYTVESNLLPVLVDAAIALTLERGLLPLSPVAFANYGLIEASLGNLPIAAKFGEIALRLAERPRSIEHRPLTHFAYYNFIHHWSRPLPEALAPLHQAYAEAVEVGDPQYAGFIAAVEMYQAFSAGVPLRDIDELGRRYAPVVSAHRTQFMLCEATRQFVLNLAGDSPDVLRLEGTTEFQPDRELPAAEARRDDTLICAYHLIMLGLRFWTGTDLEGALDHAVQAERHLAGMAGTPNVPLFHLSNAIVRLRVAPQAITTRRAVRRAVKRYERWASAAPANYLAGLELLRAERARPSQPRRALHHYESAIAAGDEFGMPFIAAWARRAAAELHLRAGRETLARPLLLEAHSQWSRLGARALTDALEGRHPWLGGTSARSARGLTVDAAALLEAGTTIAEETQLDGVVERILTVSVRDAGAQVGAFFRVVDGAPALYACCVDGHVQFAGDAADQAPFQWAREPVAAVAAGGPTVLLDDAVSGRVAGDPAVVERGVRSLLVMPIVRGNAVVGVLYLENNEFPQAFTPERQRALQLLSGQIAVSINNAVLADDLRRSLTRERAITAAQRRFIPDQFLQAIGASDIGQVRTGAAAEREVTLLFSDLRGSTGLEETMTPIETGQFINWYLAYLERELASCGGFVESFQGDGILAVFDGAPDHALDAALAMQRAHADMNKSLHPTSTEIKTGIGINTGPVLMGAFGSSHRLKCGVLGDAVNLASRIEGQTKVYGVPILVSHHTVEALHQPSRFDLEKVDVIRVSGRVKEVALYSVNGYA